MPEQEKKLNIDFEFLDEQKDVKTVKQTEAAIIEPVQKQEAAVRVTKEDVKKVKGTSSTHPWLRYWARSLDVFIGGFGLGIILAFTYPSIADVPSMVLSMIVLFVWVFIEAALLSSWGTTPGKWLLRIKIKGPKDKIDFSSALNRSFNVWYKGFGFGIPIVYLFTLISSYKHLTKEGITPWDQDGGFTLSFEKLGFFRMIIPIIVSIIIVIIMFS
ncbi:MAG: RDD family protein [Candidatus Staskawiczbacteria bacterium]|nr:RDD family protein [Candidatus Staskawiczbacteria bacterium]